MIEIKFRAWHREAKQMLYPENNRQDYVFGWLYEGQPIEIMQFTGLKDENGKEIYEGDICDNGAAKWEVIFNTGCFCAKKVGYNYPEDQIHLALRAVKGLVVIGNIYENEIRQSH